MLRSLLLLSLVGALASGCVVRARGGYVASGGATVVATSEPPPTGLVYVSDGVQVVADYDYPVFYAEGVYWRFDNGVWYRSNAWNRGWVVSYNVPVRVRTIDRPATYVRYRGGGYVRGGGGTVVRDNPGQHRGWDKGAPGGGVEVRDHRGGPPADRGGPPADRGGPPDRGGPVVRDHREGGPPADKGGPPAKDNRGADKDKKDDSAPVKTRDHRK